MSVKTALVEAFVVLLLAGLIASRLSVMMLVIVAVYVLLQVCYTELLKHKVLLDVICIAIGFVLRASAGAIAIGVEVSPWLFICMFTLCLFMGFCKRYSEFITLGDAAKAYRHRATLLEYSPELLTHLITVSAGIAVVSFLLYGLSDEASIFGGVYFIYTLPVVVYGIFRFAMLSMKGVYSDPTDLILHDRVFQVTVVIWSVMAIAIIFYGTAISQFLQGLNG
jgi:4-hydroxybenzoate polyprenyltransferase